MSLSTQFSYIQFIVSNIEVTPVDEKYSLLIELSSLCKVTMKSINC